MKTAMSFQWKMNDFISKRSLTPNILKHELTISGGKWCYSITVYIFFFFFPLNFHTFNFHILRYELCLAEQLSAYK